MKLLFAQHEFPEFDTSAGALRTTEIIRILRDAGHTVSFLAHGTNAPRYRAALEHMGVTCVSEDNMAAGSAEFGAFLQAGQFGLAVCAHYYNYARYAPFLRVHLPACPVVLDTVDIHFLRLERQAALYPEQAAEAAQVRADETAALRDADAVWVVTPDERDLVTSLPGCADKSVHILPTLHPLLPDPPPLAKRQGIVFLGGYRHAPNVDAVQFFLEQVLPHLRVLLPDVSVFVAGSNPPPEFDAFRALPGVQILGFVDDHRALLSSCHVGVAPLRFGAGMKGKIGEYLACGLPCVTTPVGAEGMDLTDGQDVLIADGTHAFAQSVAALCTDDALWQSMSDAGRAYIGARFTPEAIAPALLAAMDETTRRGAASLSGGQRAGRALSGLSHYLSNPRALRRAWAVVRQMVRGGNLSALRERVRVWAVKTRGGA